MCLFCACHCEQRERKFVISFYLADDTLSVFEVAEPNSGLTPGKFLDRGKYKKATVTPLSGTDVAFAQPFARQRRVLASHLFGMEQGERAVAGDGILTGIGCGPTDSDTASYFTVDDFKIGALLEFQHCPGQLFKLMEADEYTKAFLGDASASPVLPRGVDVPVAAFAAFRAMARYTKGCMNTLCGMLRRLDDTRSFDGPYPRAVNADVLRVVLARVGVYAPAVASADITTAIAACTDSKNNMTDVRRFMTTLQAAMDVNALNGDRHDSTFKQLQSQMLSSLAHLRKVFRDLDVANAGAITANEMRQLLQRHNLDAGYTDSDVLEFMARFPAAQSAAKAACGDACAVDWRGFIDVLFETSTLSLRDVDTVSEPLCGEGGCCLCWYQYLAAFLCDCTTFCADRVVAEWRGHCPGCHWCRPSTICACAQLRCETPCARTSHARHHCTCCAGCDSYCW